MTRWPMTGLRVSNPKRDNVGWPRGSIWPTHGMTPATAASGAIGDIGNQTGDKRVVSPRFQVRRDDQDTGSAYVSLPNKLSILRYRAVATATEDDIARLERRLKREGYGPLVVIIDTATSSLLKQFRRATDALRHTVSISR